MFDDVVPGRAAPSVTVRAVWNDEERAALVALLRARPNGMTWPEIVADIEVRESALDLWHTVNPPELLGGEPEAMVRARKDVAVWRAEGTGFLTFLDEEYPARLRAVFDLPPILFHRGTLVPDDVAVSVVGSRNATEQGLSIARSVAGGLVDRGVSVVSGLARGIDTAAHEATLDAGGRAVAVIGTGLDRYYPPENRSLQDRIAREGLLLSQFWLDAPPAKHAFPLRNSTMSGYGLATVVVEAGERSGARTQARRAVAHGRPVILTDRVVGANEWARAMVDLPGVHVAASTAAVMEFVEEIATDPRRIDDMLVPSATPW